MKSIASPIEQGRARWPALRTWAAGKARAAAPMLADVTAVFMLSRVVFYIAAIAALAAIPEYRGSLYTPWHAPTFPLIDASWRWDAGWYLDIATRGYQWHGGESNVAFFPLYPLLIRAAWELLPGHRVFLFGVLINDLAFFLALIAIWHYAQHIGGRDVARRTVYLLAIFPTAFFYAAAYSEAVFLLVTAVSLVAMQRGRFGTAGAAGFFAGLARPPGVYLGVAYLIFLWRHRAATWTGRLRQLAPVLLLPAGLGAYMLYLELRFGDPLLFVKAQDAWGRLRMLPWSALLKAIELTLTRPWDVPWLMGGVNTAAAVLALVLAAVALRRDPAGGTYGLVTIVAALAFPIGGMPTISVARFVAALFPLFVPLARWSSRWPVLIALTALFLPLQALLAALFVRWYQII